MCLTLLSIQYINLVFNYENLFCHTADSGRENVFFSHYFNYSHIIRQIDIMGYFFHFRIIFNYFALQLLLN